MSLLSYFMLGDAMLLMVQSLVTLLQPNVFFFGARGIEPVPDTASHFGILEVNRLLFIGLSLVAGTLLYYISESKDTELKHYTALTMLVWHAAYIAIELYVGVWFRMKLSLVRSVLVILGYFVLLFVYPERTDKKKVTKTK